MEKLLSFFKSAKAELSKVFFPNKSQVKNAAITVASVVIIVALFIALVDLIMSFSIGNILR